MEFISNIVENDNTLTFRISGLNVSYVNAIRRIILSEIKTIVFRTTPYDKNRVKISVNTTRMNNEIIKQRISCIPIYIDNDVNIENYTVEVDVKNDTETIKYVTTKDFLVKKNDTGKYIDESDRDKIFPPDSITNDYIELVRLRPKISENGVEQLKFSATFDYGLAKEDGAFNVVSTCSYVATPDMNKANEAWKKKESEYKEQDLVDTDIKTLKDDWFLLDAKRIIKEDEFDFIVETLGPIKNKDIVVRAIEVMNYKLQKFIEDLNKKNEMVNKSSSTIENCFDIVLIDEDYTLGKVIEYNIYNNHYNKDVTYCGFIKPHPHINMSIIRVGLKNKETDVKNLLIESATEALNVYNKLNGYFASV